MNQTRQSRLPHRSNELRHPEMTELARTVSADPGLLSPEELLSEQGGRRKSLEELIAQRRALSQHEDDTPFHRRCREFIRWFLDTARLKISVSIPSFFILFLF